MKRRLFALALALLLAVSLPVSALAGEWFIDDGDIIINATADGKQTVKQGNNGAVEDAAPVIKQKDSSTSTSNTITIDADENATANVTLGGVNIDVSKHTDNTTAGIQTTGNGDVSIELDGKNPVKSADYAAGLQKENGGNLTIKDDNTTAGKLEATGGRFAAGIGRGNGNNKSVANITITGGEIIAKGGNGAAGLGCGASFGSQNSASDIRISGGKVTATGGDGGAGIGGGRFASASDIEITGGEVTAKGGPTGAGIGGGYKGSGSDISISGDAQVKVQGGSTGLGGGAGAGIGNGGSYEEDESHSTVYIDGDEVEPDTSGLTENGRLEYYAPGADMEKDYPEKVIENKPEMGAQPGASAPVYSVTDKDGNAVSYTAAREGGVLTIRVDAAYARLTLTADEAQALTAQSVEKVVFVTTGATSAFRPADLTAYKDEAPFVLTHDGETVTFTAGETDLASLLLQA